MKQTVLAAVAAVLLANVSTMPAFFPLPLGITQAQAQSALTLENLRFKGEQAEVIIPRIVIEGSTASRADIEALFDAKALNQLGPRLAGISARSVTIPVIEIRQSTPEMDAVTTYRDTVMRDIRNGVIAEIVTPVATTKSTPKPQQKLVPAMDMDMANMVLKGIDLPLMLRFVYDRAAATEALRPAAAEQTIGRMNVRIAEMGTVSIDSMRIKDFKLRPLERPLIDFVTDAQRSATGVGKADEKGSILMMSSLMSSMSYDNIEMNGLKGEFTSPRDKSVVRLAMNKLSGAGGGDVAGRFSLQGLSVHGADMNIGFGEFTVEGLDMSNLWAELRKAAAGPTFKPDTMDPTAAIPKLSLVRLAGIDISVPDPKAAGQTIKAKLGRFETRMSNHVGPIPANIGLNIDRFQLDIPPDTRESGLRDILALGYNMLDVSMSYEQLWDSARKTLSLKDYSITSAGMFRTSASAEITNVPREVFTLDKAKASVAALGMAAQSMKVSLINDGLVERLMAQQASQQKRKVEDVRAELAAGATLLVPMMMGDHPGAKVLGAALGKFVAEPKNVNVVLTAKGEGLGAMDFLAAGNPQDVLKKVDITAGANQ